jgi:hypothetical protein
VHNISSTQGCVAHPTAEALADDLGAFAEGWPTSARGPNVIERLVAMPRRGQHAREFRTRGNIFPIGVPIAPDDR